MQANSLTQKAISVIQDKGKFAIAQACQAIIESQYDNGIICHALHFYARQVLPKVFPIFPALVYLSNDCVGFIPSNSKAIATSIMLITASGDIHDDIVDNSKLKFGKKTIVGKYGKNAALLAGDVLLVHGMTALQHEISDLSVEHREEINNLVACSMFEISKAEVIETSFFKTMPTSERYFEILKLKGAVAEVHCRIGGIMGGAKEEVLENLGRYGRAVGILSTLKEEFVDLTSPSELRHRLTHELPPYPMLCAMQNKAVGEEINVITKKAKLSISDLRKVACLVMDSFEVKKLALEFRQFGRRELSENPLLKNNVKANELIVLLEGLTEELLVV